MESRTTTTDADLVDGRLKGPGRALILGGGGITGIAWELGIIAALAEAGVDLTSADLVVGTSAGSVVGAELLSGTPPDALYAAQLVDPTGETANRMSAGALARFVIAALWPGDGSRGRIYLGRAALRASTISESEWLRVFEAILKGAAWPERRLLTVAVDAQSGEPRVFDRDSSASLVEAVAASCAVPMVYPPVTIDGRRYIDGGVRSVVNADLATGCDTLVVIAPVTVAFRRRMGIARQLSTLGPDVRSVVISPDATARGAIGRNVLDPVRRADSARAGMRQGAGVVGEVRAIWSTGR